MNKKNLIFGLLLTASVGFLGIQKKGVTALNRPVAVNNKPLPESFVYGDDYVTLNEIPWSTKEYTYNQGPPENRFARVTLSADLTFSQWASYGFLKTHASGLFYNEPFIYTNINDVHFTGPQTSSLYVDIYDSYANETISIYNSGIPSSIYDKFYYGVPYHPSFVSSSYYSSTALKSDYGTFNHAYNSWFNITASGLTNLGGLANEYLSISITWQVDNTKIFDGKWGHLLSDLWFGTYGYALSHTYSDDAFTLGFDSGYETGKTDGYNEGYGIGKQVGYSEGKKDGFDLGVENTEISGSLMGSTIYMVIGSIANFIVSISAFEVMGLSIGSIVAFIVTVGLTIFILGVVRK